MYARWEPETFPWAQHLEEASPTIQVHTAACTVVFAELSLETIKNTNLVYPAAVSRCCYSIIPVFLHRHQEEYRALRAQEESESQFKNSKEGGYTSQGWTHIPLINSREPPELYEPQRSHFPKTLKVCVLMGGVSVGARPAIACLIQLLGRRWCFA